MKPRALGIYIYGGGFYFGVRPHWQVLAHLEDGPIVNTTVFSHNVPEIPVRFAPDWGLETYKNQVDVVYANPPCAIWSPIGRSMFHGAKSYLEDPRVECWENCVKVGLATEPQVLIIETVPRGHTIGRDFLIKKARQLQERGYKTHLFLHSTLWMGAPQNRKRLFFIASKVKWEPLDEPWETGMTVNEALAAITENIEPLWKLPETWKEFWVRQGDPELRKGSRDWMKQRGTKPVPAFMNCRLQGDKPMGAFCGAYYLHPTEPRALSMPEARALCGYPPSYSFPDQYTLQRCCTVFAQAVMPWAGDWIARSAVTAIENNEPVKDIDEVVIWDWRREKRKQELYAKLGEES